jgi:hypothetical protein
MLCEVIRSFRNYREGQRFDWDESTIVLLERRGLVKRVAEEKSVDTPDANKAILRAPRKKAVTVGG